MAQINMLSVVTMYFVLLFALTVHECAHALAAEYCGDSTARFMGRISLNPLAHIDPIGTVLIPLVMMFTGARFLIGWAKPVMVNPRNFRNFRRDDILVSMAGIAANVTLAVLVALVLRLMMVAKLDPGPGLANLLLFLMWINTALAVFNIIPIPPLDGSHVLEHFLPPELAEGYRRLGAFSFIILIVLIYTRVIHILIAVPTMVLMKIAGV